MILPDSETRALHTGRRVAAFLGLKSTNRLTGAAATTREADRNGIIRLTVTA
jgi:hypothetical protein